MFACVSRVIGALDVLYPSIKHFDVFTQSFVGCCTKSNTIKRLEKEQICDRFSCLRSSACPAWAESYDLGWKLAGEMRDGRRL